VDALGSGADGPAIPGCDVATAASRADNALDAMLASFWNQTTMYFDDIAPANQKRTGYWTFAQAFDAVLDGAQRPGGAHYRTWIATLFAAQSASGWSSNYYDDENWMALALIRAFDQAGQQAYLGRARMLYAEINAAWDDTSAHPGGIWWDRAHTQKATASNAGPVITAVRLAARTGDASALAFARKVYAFWFTTMVNASTGQVADHLTAAGVVERGQLTYNEGLMSGAALALYQATGEAHFLAEARANAHVLITAETKVTPAGRVLSDGTNTSCTGDCPQWKGVGYRYLAALYEQDPTQADYRAVLESSATAAWTLGRNTGTGLFANDWAGPAPTTSADIEAQSSSVSALNLLAYLCGG
jgi:predicted alpha-1,6-mannanase (GH76 family)